jgi:homoserine dehydrogenase
MMGGPIELQRVALAHPDEGRSIELPADLITTDALAVAIDPDIDIVIESIGDLHVAFEAVRAALSDNKMVITTNTELMARHGDELLDEGRGRLYFDAGVWNAIPIVRVSSDRCEGDDATAAVVLGNLVAAGRRFRENRGARACSS